jgi:hypothetical protein
LVVFLTILIFSLVSVSIHPYHRFGGSPNNYPHPREDIKEYCAMMKTQMKKVGKVFNPRTKQMENWIRLSKVRSKAGGGCIIC